MYVRVCVCACVRVYHQLRLRASAARPAAARGRVSSEVSTTGYHVRCRYVVPVPV